MEKKNDRPVPDPLETPMPGVLEAMDAVPMTEMTGAIPALLTPQQQAEVLRDVFHQDETHPYDE